MFRRVSTFLAAAAVAVVALAARPAPTRASEIPPAGTTYLLTNTGDQPIKSIDAIVTPAGGLYTPDASDPNAVNLNAPLPWIGSLTFHNDSVGVDKARLQVTAGTGNYPPPDGPLTEVIRLTFGVGNASKNIPDSPGLLPGQSIHFGLRDASGAEVGRSLELVSSLSPITPMTSGDLSLTYVPPAGAVTTGGSGDNPPPTAPTTTPPSPPPLQTPEPLSMALWSALAGLGLLRARIYRRRHPARA